MEKVLVFLVAAVVVLSPLVVLAEEQSKVSDVASTAPVAAVSVPEATPDQQAVLAVPAAAPMQEPAAPEVKEAAKEISKEQVLAIATAAVQEKGFKLDAASVIYDDGDKLWSQKVGVASIENTSPNHGILVKGFLKNYRIVYFDYKEPIKDVWVFIDKDSGEVLEVYQEQ